MRGSPALSVQLTPGGSGQGLEVPRIADFTHRPGLEPATGDEPAPNFLLSQWDHGSRPAPPAPKVRENPKNGVRVCHTPLSIPAGRHREPRRWGPARMTSWSTAMSALPLSRTMLSATS